MRCALPVGVYALAAVIVAGAGGCMLQSPDYQQTRFSCEPGADPCPEGFRCEGGMCLPDGTAGVDAGVPSAVDAAPRPDAVPGTEPPDAGPQAVVRSFGERVGAEVTGVTHDTWLDYSNPNDESGADDDVHVDAAPEKIGLLRFDLSSIPPTAQVLSAELVVYLHDPFEDGDLVVHRMLVAWSEQDADYVRRLSGTSWAVPGAGGDAYAAQPIATITPRNVGDYQLALSIATVQQWVADPAANHGMRLSSNSADGRGGTFYSSESAQSQLRPLLRVTYLPQ